MRCGRSRWKITEARLARLALDLPPTVDALSKRHNMNLHIRIGMASGPVMAGVIGADKFFYDVWGETVNLASRLETHGLPGEVHVSRRGSAGAWRRQFQFEPRGRVDIKGVGKLDTWLLKGEKTKLNRSAFDMPKSMDCNQF